MNKKRNDLGQMLLEVVVAVGLIVLVLTVSANLVTRTMKTGRTSLNRSFALSLANACLEKARSEKDSDVEVFFNRFILEEEISDNCVCDGLDNVECSLIYSKLETSVDEVEKVRVKSIVRWTDNSDALSESVSTVFIKDIGL